MKMVGGHGIQSFSLVAKISEIHMKISSFRKKICFHYLFIIKTWFLWKIGTLRKICKFSFCFIHISFWILNCSRGRFFYYHFDWSFFGIWFEIPSSQTSWNFDKCAAWDTFNCAREKNMNLAYLKIRVFLEKLFKAA